MNFLRIFFIVAIFNSMHKNSYSTPPTIASRNYAFDYNSLSLQLILASFAPDKDIHSLYLNNKIFALIDQIKKNDINILALQELKGTTVFENDVSYMDYLPEGENERFFSSLLAHLNNEGFTHIGLSGSNSLNNLIRFKENFEIKNNNDLLLNLNDPQQKKKAVKMLTVDTGFKNAILVKEGDDFKINDFKSCATVYNKNNNVIETVDLHNLNTESYDPQEKAGGGGFKSNDTFYQKYIGSSSIVVAYKDKEDQEKTIQVITEQAVVRARNKITQINNAINTHKASVDTDCTIAIGDFNRIRFDEKNNDYEKINNTMEQSQMTELPYHVNSWYPTPTSTEAMFRTSNEGGGKLDAAYVNKDSSIGYQARISSLTPTSEMQLFIDDFFNNSVTIPINTEKTPVKLKHFAISTGIFNITVKKDKFGYREGSALDKPVFNQHIKAIRYEGFLDSKHYPKNDNVKESDLNSLYKEYMCEFRDRSLELNKETPLINKLLDTHLPVSVEPRMEWQKEVLMNFGDHKTLVLSPNN